MRARMKFHNLRDTCLTHMAVRRGPPQDIQWRAGHTTSAMTEACITNARYQAGASFGTPLPSSVLARSPADKTTNPRFCRGFVVEAPGIEPGSENVDATCVYVRIRPFKSS